MATQCVSSSDGSSSFQLISSRELTALGRKSVNCQSDKSLTPIQVSPSMRGGESAPKIMVGAMPSHHRVPCRSIARPANSRVKRYSNFDQKSFSFTTTLHPPTPLHGPEGVPPRPYPLTALPPAPSPSNSRQTYPAPSHTAATRTSSRAASAPARRRPGPQTLDPPPRSSTLGAPAKTR